MKDKGLILKWMHCKFPYYVYLKYLKMLCVSLIPILCVSFYVNSHTMCIIPEVFGTHSLCSTTAVGDVIISHCFPTVGDCCSHWRAGKLGHTSQSCQWGVWGLYFICWPRCLSSKPWDFTFKQLGTRMHSIPCTQQRGKADSGRRYLAIFCNYICCSQLVNTLSHLNSHFQYPTLS